MTICSFSITNKFSSNCKGIIPEFGRFTESPLQLACGKRSVEGLADLVTVLGHDPLFLNASKLDAGVDFRQRQVAIQRWQRNHGIQTSKFFRLPAALLSRVDVDLRLELVDDEVDLK